MSLTDDWIAGKLKEGSKYWITYKEGKPFVATFKRSKAFIDFWKFYDLENEYDDGAGYNYVKVLAEVPSYEEWQHKCKQADNNINHWHETYRSNTKLIDNVMNKKRENQQFRQLLKECKDIIEWYKADTGYIDLPTENILTRINAAIVESEE